MKFFVHAVERLFLCERSKLGFYVPFNSQAFSVCALNLLLCNYFSKYSVCALNLFLLIVYAFMYI